MRSLQVRDDVEVSVVCLPGKLAPSLRFIVYMFRGALSLLFALLVIFDVGSNRVIAAPISKAKALKSPKATVRVRKSRSLDRSFTMQFREGALHVRKGWFRRFTIPDGGKISFRRFSHEVTVESHASQGYAIAKIPGLHLTYELRRERGTGSWYVKGSRETWGWSRPLLHKTFSKVPGLRWLAARMRHPVYRAVGLFGSGLRWSERTRLLGGWFGGTGSLPRATDALNQGPKTFRAGDYSDSSIVQSLPATADGRWHRLVVSHLLGAYDGSRTNWIWTSLWPHVRPTGVSFWLSEQK